MESFARELRVHCARKGTIAQLCKATGINRQQFNKYLAGQMLPGARTMRKICSYLGVSEEQLMSGRASVESATDYSGPLPPVVPPTNLLQNGFYRAYCPVRDRPDLVARWLVHVTNDPQGRQVHSCRNRFEDGISLGYSANRLTYRGPVTYGPGEAGLFGTARTPVPLHGIISVNLRPVVEPDYFSALVLTRRAEGPLALSAVLHFLGPACTARQALGGVGIARLHDPAMDPVIVRLMQVTPAAGSNWMHSIT